jgi:hypothetical protein
MARFRDAPTKIDTKIRISKLGFVPSASTLVVERTWVLISSVAIGGTPYYDLFNYCSEYWAQKN